MSDEFLRLAAQEVNEEIFGLEEILSKCSDDASVSLKADNFEKHTHKIKGLAPMMGKESLGNLAANLDSILKKIIDGSKVDGIHAVLVQSVSSMKSSMSEPNTDLAELQKQTSQILENLN